MTKRELEKKLQDAGFTFEHGGNHDLAIRGKQKIPIPRHKGDIPKGTADSILKAAGLK